MKKRGALGFLLFFWVPFVLLSQESFKEWQQKQQKAFQEHASAEDQEFQSFLKREWEEFQLFQGLVLDSQPKPHTIPQAEPRVFELPEKNSGAVVLKTEPETERMPDEVGEVAQPRADSGEPNFVFFGVPLVIPWQQFTSLRSPSRIDGKTIAGYWEQLSKTGYSAFIARVLDYKERLNLNDWGYALLLERMGEKLYKDSSVQVRLFLWFMLVQSGYNVKLGYNQNQVFVLASTQNIIYGVPFFYMEGIRYFVLEFHGGNGKLGALYTYEGSYAGADKALDLRMNGMPRIGVKDSYKRLTFSYFEHQYVLNIEYNANLVEYLKEYPHTEAPVYFSTALSNPMESSLARELRPILAGKSQLEAVNVILRFVQTAFNYRTDDQQFGKEKWLFPEEMIYYPYSDCEDRSVFFAALVKELLGLTVIGLDFPGHIATAVHFQNKLSGDSFLFKGEWFTVCDPTYVNANVGMSMPQYQGQTPAVIMF